MARDLAGKKLSAFLEFRSKFFNNLNMNQIHDQSKFYVAKSKVKVKHSNHSIHPFYYLHAH